MEKSLIVSGPEDGMRLKTFLERRLEPTPPSADLYRWIRTGQVRVNKGRSRADACLREGDVIRLPPFARAREVLADGPAATEPDLPMIVARKADYLVLAKPAGLAVQPGTGLDDSLADRLKAAYAGQPYPPAPAHRLDRHVSGLLLAGTTRAAQERLSTWFAEPGAIKKEYLAWVSGSWPGLEPGAEPLPLTDWLKKERQVGGREVTTVVPPGTQGAVEARCLAQCLEKRCLEEKFPGLDRASLLKIHLLTGRTHQIRAQLAARGVPIIGDGRHQGRPFQRLLLHAFRLTLPDGEVYTLAPDWPQPFSISSNFS